jgi:hypothetical protein
MEPLMKVPRRKSNMISRTRKRSVSRSAVIMFSPAGVQTMRDGCAGLVMTNRDEVSSLEALGASIRVVTRDTRDARDDDSMLTTG